MNGSGGVPSTALSQELKAFYYNATSIRGKLNDFNHHFDNTCEYDFISVTETWLNENIFDGEIPVLINSNYNIFRKDRDTIVSNKKDGGGVLVAVSYKFSSRRRHDLETDCEAVWVEIQLNADCKLFLATVYVPPDSQLSVCSHLEDSLEKVRSMLRPNDSMLILGDFDMSDAVWSTSDGLKWVICKNRSNVCGKTARLLEAFDYSELQQHNVLPTCNRPNKPLDLVYSNDELDISVNYASNPTSSTHFALDVGLCISLSCNSTANHNC